MHCAAYGKFIETFSIFFDWRSLTCYDGMIALRSSSYGLLQALPHPWRQNNLRSLDSTVLHTFRIPRCQHAREGVMHFQTVGVSQDRHALAYPSSLPSVRCHTARENRQYPSFVFRMRLTNHLRPRRSVLGFVRKTYGVLARHVPSDKVLDAFLIVW